ncbi:DUF2934 domain-containing protein [Pseudomonas sp. v388]|uniref:DUF2934 domain-containing protein n=1 Tax=Pseudomonas sp. v388 TaxID=2479849 RepID=UPI000F793C17|nr:DUF2934 domain-containing protein [Pseudomonas sp. v388]RRV07489.1 DUF2934 domain-containing protein [Pseudomonas sp. v388]
MIDEAKIREKAYELWEQAGGQEGSPETYWHRARSLLEAEQGGASGVDTRDEQSDDLESGADQSGGGTSADESQETSAS